MKAILKVLRSIQLPGESRGQAYEIHHKVLNTKEHSVPQNRPRWYCVGIRKDTFQGESSTFAFPEPISPCPTIDLFLDEDSKVETNGYDDLNSRAKARIRRLKQQTEGSDETPYIVDCEASESRASCMKVCSRLAVKGPPAVA